MFSQQVNSYEGKKDSAYVLIIYNYDTINFIEFIKSKMYECNKIKDPIIKKNTNDIYFSIINLIEEKFKIQKKLNIIIFSTIKFIEYYNLSINNINILKDFNCPNITIKYDNYFDCNWIIDYISDKSFINEINIYNNSLKLFHINSTKYKCIIEINDKTKNINDFIKENISNEKYIIHGSSHKFKNYNDKDNNLIFFENKQLSHSEVYDIYLKVLNIENVEEVKKTLEFLKNKKNVDLISLGHNKIFSDLENGYLEKIYCYKKIYVKLNELIIKNNLSVATQIIQIKLDKKIDDTLILKQFGGIIGLKYSWAMSL